MHDGKGNVLSDNDVTGSYIGVHLDSESNVSVVGASSTLINQYGIYVSASHDVSVSGCTFFNSGIQGITLPVFAENSARFTVTGCSSREVNSGPYTDQTYWLFDGCSEFSAVGNSIAIEGGMGYCLALNSCSDGIVANNVFEFNVSGGGVLETSSTATLVNNITVDKSNVS